MNDFLLKMLEKFIFSKFFSCYSYSFDPQNVKWKKKPKFARYLWICGASRMRPYTQLKQYFGFVLHALRFTTGKSTTARAPSSGITRARLLFDPQKKSVRSFRFVSFCTLRFQKFSPRFASQYTMHGGRVCAYYTNLHGLQTNWCERKTDVAHT